MVAVAVLEVVDLVDEVVELGADLGFEGVEGVFGGLEFGLEGCDFLLQLKDGFWGGMVGELGHGAKIVTSSEWLER